MPTISHQHSKKGFTIIEVVLVLAIAGLIFLMVFLALPALQSSQRDTQRRDQLSMFLNQIIQYQANNRNRVPQCANSATCSVMPEDGVIADEDAKTDWGRFYKQYLLANGADLFEDPLGHSYGIYVVPCKATGGKDGDDCDNLRMDANFSDGNNEKEPDNVDQNYYIMVTTNSSCDGEKSVYNSGSRRVSVSYRLEGGGTFCQSN